MSAFIQFYCLHIKKKKRNVNLKAENHALKPEIMTSWTIKALFNGKEKCREDPLKNKKNRWVRD